MVPFKSATIVASSGGKLFLVPLQSVVFCGILWDVCLVPFKSAFIVVSSGGKFFWFLFSHFFLLHLAGICFWFLLSQHPLMPHLAGS